MVLVTSVKPNIRKLHTHIHTHKCLYIGINSFILKFNEN